MWINRLLDVLLVIDPWDVFEANLIHADALMELFPHACTLARTTSVLVSLGIRLRCRTDLLCGINPLCSTDSLSLVVGVAW